MRKFPYFLMMILAGASTACAGQPYDPGYYDRDYYTQSNYEHIARAAHRLENAADHFYRQLRHDVGHDHAARDAKELAKAARHFHRQVERGGSYGHLRSDYDELERAYFHARRELSRRYDLRYDPHLGGDFGDVERAFHDLNRTIGYVLDRSHRRHG